MYTSHKTIFFELSFILLWLLFFHHSTALVFHFSSKNKLTNLAHWVLPHVCDLLKINTQRITNQASLQKQWITNQASLQKIFFKFSFTTTLEEFRILKKPFKNKIMGSASGNVLCLLTRLPLGPLVVSNLLLEAIQVHKALSWLVIPKWLRSTAM